MFPKWCIYVYVIVRVPPLRVYGEYTGGEVVTITSQANKGVSP